MVKDTPLRALLTVLVTAVVCSSIVSASVVLLRPVQLNNQLLERSSNIVALTGQLPQGEISDENLLALFKSLDARVVDIDEARLDSEYDAYTFDARKAAIDSAELLGILALVLVNGLLAGAVLFGGPFAGPIWDQYFVQSPEAQGLAQHVPDWLVPPPGSAALVNRSFVAAAWIKPILVLVATIVLVLTQPFPPWAASACPSAAAWVPVSAPPAAGGWPCGWSEAPNATPTAPTRTRTMAPANPLPQRLVRRRARQTAFFIKRPSPRSLLRFDWRRHRLPSSGHPAPWLRSAPIARARRPVPPGRFD